MKRRPTICGGCGRALGDAPRAIVDAVPVCLECLLPEPGHPGALHAARGDVEQKDFQVGDVRAHDKAKRLAQLIVSEILLYHPSWRGGSQDDELRDEVSLDVEQGRHYYARRVSEELLDSTDYYDEAVRSLLGDVITSS